MTARANRITSTASSARRSVGPARRRTQAERSEETRTRILKAAANLIRKRGYARFRTAEVAKEAGLSRGAQLHHFPTKDSLVVATLEHVFEQAQVQSRRRASAVNRPRDLIEAVIEDAREFFFSEHFMVAIDIVLSTSTDQSVRKQILDISRKARRPVESAWSEALAANGVPGQLASDLVALTLSLVRGMALRTLWDNDPKWFDELFSIWRQMIKVFLSNRQPRSGVRSGRPQA
jgi:AcrR family transcriptional regulator